MRTEGDVALYALGTGDYDELCCKARWLMTCHICCSIPVSSHDSAHSHDGTADTPYASEHMERCLGWH